jgi:hypothetical protein
VGIRVPGQNDDAILFRGAMQWGVGEREWTSSLRRSGSWTISRRALRCRKFPTELIWAVRHARKCRRVVLESSLDGRSEGSRCLAPCSRRWDHDRLPLCKVCGKQECGCGIIMEGARVSNRSRPEFATLGQLDGAGESEFLPHGPLPAFASQQHARPPISVANPALRQIPEPNSQCRPVVMLRLVQSGSGRWGSGRSNFTAHSCAS